MFFVCNTVCKMNLINILIFVAALHFLLFFFNTIFTVRLWECRIQNLIWIDIFYVFQTCMHYPYISLLKKSGVKIHFLRIKLFTTALNRTFMKWGVSGSKFWSVWFNAGIFASIGLLCVSLYIVVKMSLDITWETNASDDKSGDMTLELVVIETNIFLKRPKMQFNASR